jgi:hypothetical protein
MGTLSDQLTHVTENSLFKIFTSNANKINNLPTPRNPKFIIKYGPPASGKGSDAVKSLIKDLGDPLNTYININVDDAVESTEMFTRTSRDLVKNIKNIKNLETFLNDATPEEVSRLAKTYTNIRFGKNTKGRTIGNKMDNLLTQALQAKKNVTFETTGGVGFPIWLRKSPFKELLEGYQIIIIFPLVPFEETWRRYKMRPIEVYRKGGGFRFASTKSELHKVYINSYNNFITFLHNREQLINWINKIYILPPTDSVLIINKNKNTNLNRAITSISTVSRN